jgi:hypothetical protein
MFKPWFLSLIFLMAGSVASADLSHDILGKWRYDGFIYRDHRYPNPNPRLNVEFMFIPDHTARLFWKREDETGFCERKGVWQVEGDLLIQSVNWLNPANDPSCSQDPDMQINRTTQNRIDLMGTQLNLHLNLDGRDFIYILILEGP